MSGCRDGRSFTSTTRSILRHPSTVVTVRLQSITFVLTNSCLSPESYPSSGTDNRRISSPRRSGDCPDEPTVPAVAEAWTAPTTAPSPSPFPSTLREAVLQRGCQRQLLGTSPLLRRLRPRRTCPRHTLTLACARSRSHSHMLALSRACTHARLRSHALALTCAHTRSCTHAHHPRSLALVLSRTHDLTFPSFACPLSCSDDRDRHAHGVPIDRVHDACAPTRMCPRHIHLRAHGAHAAAGQTRSCAPAATST